MWTTSSGILLSHDSSHCQCIKKWQIVISLAQKLPFEIYPTSPQLAPEPASAVPASATFTRFIFVWLGFLTSLGCASAPDPPDRYWSGFQEMRAEGEELGSEGWPLTCRASGLGEVKDNHTSGTRGLLSALPLRAACWWVFTKQFSEVSWLVGFYSFHV